MYPIVYDKLETDFSTNGLAILNKVYDLRIYERLNGEYTLSFFMPIDDKMEHVKEENYVKVKGQLFIIRRITEMREENNSTLAFVECEHVFFELLDKFIEHWETNYDTAQFILDRLLYGTRFTGNAIAVPGSKSFQITKRTAVSGIKSILDRWECEIKRNNFHIELRPQIGTVRPAEFRYRKNLRSIQRIVDSTGVITRLYVYGQDDLTIPPIDSPNIDKYPVPKEGSVTFGNVTTTATLQEMGEAYLAQVDKPKVSYEVSVVELKTLTGYDREQEEFEIGDTVKVIDEDLGIDIIARVVEYEEYPLEPHRLTVVLANFIEDTADDMSSIRSDLRDTKAKVDRTISDNGTINTEWLEGAIDVLKNAFNSAQSNWYTDENGNLIFEAQDGSSAMKLAGFGFAIANQKVGGEWQWQTFGTGEGFTANLINAGILNAALVNIIGGNYVTIDGNGFHVVDPQNNERVRAGQIGANKYGIKVTEGELYSTLVQSGEEGATTYAKLDPAGNIEARHNGIRTTYISANNPNGRIFLGNSEDEVALAIHSPQNSNDLARISVSPLAGQGISVGSTSSHLDLSDLGISLLKTNGFLGIDSGGDIEIDANGEIRVYADFRVVGAAKNLLVSTKNHGDRLLYAYEMPEPKFADQGIGKIVNGECIIELDPIFLETIEPLSEDTPYIVHLTPYDELDLYVEKINNNSFKVRERNGKSGSFAWTLAAIIRGFKGVRLERADNDDILTSNWEDMLI